MSATQAVIDEILAGHFPEAIRLSAGVPFEELRNQIVEQAYQEPSLAYYGFYVACLLDRPSAEVHNAAAELLGLVLNIYPGAYQTAVYHARQAAAAAPDNPSYKEFLLFFHNNPEHLLSRDESLGIAEELLRADPHNEAARQVIANLRR